MAWLRLTLLTPLPGQAEETRRCLDELENYVAKEEGYLMGGAFFSAEAGPTLGRFSLWRTSEEADRAATLPHVLSLRSQIHALIQPGHIEQLHEVSGARHNIPE